MSNSTAALPKLVRDLMSIGVVAAQPSTSIKEIAKLLITNNVEVIVITDRGHAIGIVGQENLLRTLLRNDSSKQTAIDIMEEKIPQIPADIPLEIAAQIMLDQGKRYLFVMHHSAGSEYPTAVISYYHLIRYISAESGEDLLDLGMHAQRRHPLTEFIARRDIERKKNIKNPL